MDNTVFPVLSQVENQNNTHSDTRDNPRESGDAKRRRKKRHQPTAYRFADLTDLGNAKRLVRHHGDDIRYCYPWKKWLVWDGTHWRLDDGAAIERHAKDTVRRMYRDAAQERDDFRRSQLALHAQASEHAARIKAMIALARSEDGIQVDPAELDKDPLVLNCRNGTLDLRTAELRPHNRADMMAKLCPTPYDATAQCPLWCAMLERIFAGDAELIGYMRRLLGYCLSGDVREQILPVAHGVGANGKSTMIGAYMAMLGSDYAIKAPRGLLDATQGERHPTELANLHGARFCAAIESAENRKLDETLVKELTGGDSITARRMKEDFWTFAPTHKLILATNHRPRITGTDYAIWRRVKLIPYDVMIPDAERDTQLSDKLAAELPGILAWCLHGCLGWQRLGMREPERVRMATADYRAAEDVLGQWIAERCVIGDGYHAKSSDLYADYAEWANAAKEHVEKQRAVGTALTERGFVLEKGTGGTRFRCGIGLLAKSE